MLGPPGRSSCRSVVSVISAAFPELGPGNPKGCTFKFFPYRYTTDSKNLNLMISSLFELAV